MKFVKPGYTIMTEINGEEMLKHVEKVGRICYKSEDKITEGSHQKFVKMLIDRGHHAMIEHAPSISVLFKIDRGVSHEAVRHRLFSFAQESTRYVNYLNKGIEFIIPCWFREDTKQALLTHGTPCGGSTGIDEEAIEWHNAMFNAEQSYNKLIETFGWKPQQARSVLPNSLKTEIVITGNIRQWRHFFSLRIQKDAHEQIQEVSRPLLAELKTLVPVMFDDITLKGE